MSNGIDGRPYAYMLVPGKALLAPAVKCFCGT